MFWFFGQLGPDLMNEKIPEEAISINPGALDFNFQKAVAGLRGGSGEGSAGDAGGGGIDLGRGGNGRGGGAGGGRRGRRGGVKAL